jgi:hypothetical protein
MKTIKLILYLCPLILVNACFTVDSFGKYWYDARIDESLIGTWENSNSENKGSLKLEESNDRMKCTYSDSKAITFVKSLNYKEQRFILAEFEEDENSKKDRGKKIDRNKLTPGGNIILYDWKGKDLIIYNLMKKGGELLQTKLGRNKIKVSAFGSETRILNDEILDALIELKNEEGAYSSEKLIKK